MWGVPRVLPNLVAAGMRSPMKRQVRNVRRHLNRRSNRAQVAKVGQFTDRLRGQKEYPSGQFFLNDQLGYTGVILHPFHVDVHEYKTDEVGEANGVAFLRLPERDEFTKETTSDVESSSVGLEAAQTEAVVTKKVHMYLALVNEEDVTDDQVACNAFFPRIPAMLGGDESSFPSIDFVLHERVRPYKPASPSARSGCALAVFENPYLEDFFTLMDLQKHAQESEASESFDMGVLANPITETQTLLEQVDTQLGGAKLYTATTNGVRVSVMPFPMMTTAHAGTTHSVGTAKKYHWCYTVTIENLTDATIKLVNRAWFTADGHPDAQASDAIDDTTASTASNTSRADEVSYFSDHSRGVLGRSPVLSAANRAFRFSSQTSLSNRDGASWGSFTFVQTNADNKVLRQFSVRIPKFYFEMPPQVVTPGQLPPLAADCDDGTSTSPKNKDSKKT